MHTSASLVCASPAAARKPAFKRRRHNHVLDSGRALTDNSNVAPTPNGVSLSLCPKLSCSACHRALSTALRPGAASPSICSRCAAPTCAICARTCTSYTRPSSLPPTPALTRSPSPSAPTPLSPKRTVLTLSYPVFLPSAKRKKPPTDKEDADGDLDGSVGRHHHDTMCTHGVVRDGTESVLVHGCGRIVCRACCVESVLNDGKLCIDCYALV